MLSPYQIYLRSEHWQLLRGAKLQIQPRCEKCGGKEEIEVHHKVYRDSWFSSTVRDLQTLCHGCHIMEHAKDWEPIRERMTMTKRDIQQCLTKNGGVRRVTIGLLTDEGWPPNKGWKKRLLNKVVDVPIFRAAVKSAQ